MIRCFILDDEQHVIDALQKYVEQTPFLTLAGTSTNGFEVLDLLDQNIFDLLFLDIQMPEISGLEMLPLVSTPIILTTAYSEYAIEGFNHGVIDYLLKPFTYARFLKAAQKASTLFKEKNTPVAEPDMNSSDTKGYLFIKGEYKGKHVKINFQDVDYIESIKNYVVFHCGMNQHMAVMSLKDIELKLPPKAFVRIHNSFIIPLDRIVAIEGNTVLLTIQHKTALRLSIGITYKAKFLELISS